jgi:hypothetical protein
VRDETPASDDENGIIINDANGENYRLMLKHLPEKSIH